jgi:hypothetical protein
MKYRTLSQTSIVTNGSFATKRGREAMDQDRRRFCLHLRDVVARSVDALEDVLAGMCLRPLSARQLNKDPQTDHGRIREADAAHARNSPFLSATYGRCTSDGECRQ